jgi:hypothetical protein
MNNWLISFIILPFIISVGDYVYVRMRVYNMRGIIQTLQIVEMQDLIIADLFLPEPRPLQINQIFVIGLNIAYSQDDNISIGTRINKLNKFVNIVYHNLNTQIIKNNIKTVARTPYIVDFSDLVWLHQLAYLPKVRENFTKSAYTALFYFLISLEAQCPSDLKEAFYFQITRSQRNL